jgi:hypothetical protein
MFDFETKAAQILKGTKGKLPKTDTIHKAIGSANQTGANTTKSISAFYKAKDDLAKVVLELQNKYDAIKNAIKQYADDIEVEDFGLDKSKPDDKKKIDELKKIVQKWLDENTKKLDSDLKGFDNVQKFLQQTRHLETAKVCSVG